MYYINYSELDETGIDEFQEFSEMEDDEKEYDEEEY